MLVVDVGVLDDGEWGGRKTRLGGNDLKEEPMRRKNKMSLFKRFSQIPPLIHSDKTKELPDIIITLFLLQYGALELK